MTVLNITSRGTISNISFGTVTVLIFPYVQMCFVLFNSMKCANKRTKHICYESPLLSRVSVDGIATGWTVWGSNTGEGEIFRTRPNRPWGPYSVL